MSTFLHHAPRNWRKGRRLLSATLRRGLLLLGVLGVVAGGLLKPCDCAERERATGPLRARIARVVQTHGCCASTGCEPERDPERPQDRGPKPCPNGALLVLKPAEEVDPEPAFCARNELTALGWTPVLFDADVRADPADYSLPPPWLVSPEGLSVFLI